MFIFSLACKMPKNEIVGRKKIPSRSVYSLLLIQNSIKKVKFSRKKEFQPDSFYSTPNLCSKEN